jgi:DNA gyrase subunit A
VLLSITTRGYIKRTMAKAFRAQIRGGRGVIGHATKNEDEVMVLAPARTLDTLLFFSDRGKVYSEKVYQIPDADRSGRGIPMVNVLALEGADMKRPPETITAVVPVSDFEAAEYCIMATRNGRIKRLPLSEFASVRPSGLIAINLDEGDELGWVRLTRGDDDIILVTEHAQALRFSEKAVRAMGRTAAGVRGIRLSGNDKLVGMEVIEPDGELAIVTTGGYGKRTPLKDYPVKGRATGGVQTLNKNALIKTGVITAVRVVQESDDVTIISAAGVTLRTRVKDISRSGRQARGVVLMNLQEGDSVASLARISAAVLTTEMEEPPSPSPAE